jgi:hypothetical protein
MVEPSLALLGDIHALKQVQWEPTVGEDPTAAEQLVRRGV